MSSSQQRLGHAFADINTHDHASAHLGDVWNIVHPAPNRPETPPSPLSTVPFARDPYFVDRGLLFSKIDQKLAYPAARAALVGLGGVGKSQLAIEYAYRRRDDSTDTWVLWIHASNASRFEQSVRNVLERLKVSGRSDPKANVFQLLRTWLYDARNGKWLIVLDNADDDSFLLEPPTTLGSLEGGIQHDVSRERRLDYVPICDHGSMLITTRSQAAALKMVEQNCIIGVGPMEKEQALALLEKKLGALHNQEEVMRLAGDLDFIPLAIVQAAAYIRERAPRCTVGQYIDGLRKNEKSRLSLLTRDEGDLQREREAKNSILLTWEISFESIRLIRRSAANLLALMSFFDRRAISKTLLKHRTSDRTQFIRSKATGKYGRTPQSDIDSRVSDEGSKDTSGAEDDEFEEDIAMLRNYSFVSITADTTVFEMHRLVQLATQRWLEKDNSFEHWGLQFIKILDDAFPPSNPRTMATCQSLFTHVISALAMEVRATEAVLRQAFLLTRGAQYASSSGAHAEAEKMEAKALWNRKTVLGDDSDEQHGRLEIMSNLAITYSRQRWWEDAVMLQEEVVKKTTELLGEVHLCTLTAINNLVDMYSHHARLEKADELRQKARKISESLESDPDKSFDERISASSDTDLVSDADSLFSVGLESVTSMSSAPPPGVWPIFEFANALFLNDEMRLIVNAAAKNQLLSSERFERNFRRIVIRCGTDFRSQSKTPEERVAGKLLQLKARDIAGLVAELTGFKPRTDQFARLRNLPQETLRDKIDRGFDDPSPHDFATTEHLDNTQSEDQESINSANDIEEPEFDVLETESFGEFTTLKNSLLGSQAYQDSKHELIAFVVRQYTKRIDNVLHSTSDGVEAKLSRQAYQDSQHELIAFVARQYTKRIDNVLRSISDIGEAKLSRQELQNFASEIRWLSPADVRFSYQEDLTRADRLKAFVEDALGESWNWWPLEARVPSLLSGYTRVRWLCVCGDERHADLPLSVANSLKELLRPRPSWVNANTPTQQSLASHSAAAKQTIVPAPAHSPGILGTTTLKNTSPGSGSTALPPGTSNVTYLNATTSTALPPSEQHVFLGARRGTDFHVVDMKVRNFEDIQFFRDLKRHYAEVRGNWRLWLSWWRFDHCEFFKFQKFAEQSFVPRRAEFPKMSNMDYTFLPRPIDPDPPITKHEFNKRYYNICERPSTWHRHKCLKFCTSGGHALAVLPKREYPLELGYDKREDIWGIFAQERRAFIGVLAYFLLLSALSIVFFFLWLTVLGHNGDLQGASVPITLVMGLFGSFFTYLYSDRETAWRADWA